jgi:hypothetical protein
MPVAKRRRSNRTHTAARAVCDPKATDASHISSLASG